MGHYDKYGRLESKDYTFSDDSYTTTYTYDENSSVKSAEIGGVGTIDYTYDNLFRLDTVGLKKNKDGSLNTAESSINGRDYEYWVSEDNLKLSYQIAKLSYPQLAEENVPYDFQYTYDANGNIKTYTEPGKDTITYTYDSQNQLTRVEVGENLVYSYTYDNLGNITETTKNGTTNEYTYSEGEWKDKLVEYNGAAIKYDEIGNPTKYYNDWQFEWKHGRQMATAEKGTTKLTFAYNADGLRTSKTVENTATKAKTEYQYYYADGKLIRQTGNNATLDFYYDDSGLPYALKYNGTIYYYVVNVQGDVLAIVDSTGQEVATYEYDPYGKIIPSDTTTAIGELNPLRYRSYIYDQESQLYYLQSRYYDPEIGRFINADGLTSTGQGLLGNNMFAYCNNNPIIGYDPTGLINWGGVAVGIGLAILTAAAVAATVATAGAASPLAAAAITTIGTVASAALGEAAVVTTVGAYNEAPVVYDVTVVGGNDRTGASLVYDFGEQTSDFYLHTGVQNNSDISVTFGSGFVYNYDKPGDYAGDFLDISLSGKYKGASMGIDYCTSPSNLKNGYKDSHALLLTSGISLSPYSSKGPTISYDYYWTIS